MRLRKRRVKAGLWLLLALVLIVAGAAALAQDADSGAALVAAARHAAQNGEWGRAVGLADEALRDGADRVQILLLKAQIYAGLRDADKQWQALQAAAALDDSLSEPRLLLAMMATDRGLWQRAAELYRQAIAANPGCQAAHLRLAELYEKNNQPQQGLKVLQQAVVNNPNDARLLLALADMYRRRHLLQQAEAVYGQILAVAEEAAQVEAYTRLGEIYTQVGQYADAFECYVKAAKLHGEPGAFQTNGYRRLFEAADSAVGDILRGAWQPYTAHVRGGPVAREEAYVAVQAAVEQIKHIKQFATQVKVPPALQLIHRQRQLYYAVAYEAAFNAQMHLDTGDKQLRHAAGQRREQAERERKSLETVSVL